MLVGRRPRRACSRSPPASRRSSRLLVVFRLGNGIGRLTNDSIHNSLLADYYSPSVRRQVFGIHRNAVYFGTIVGARPNRDAGRAVRLARLRSWSCSYPLLGVAFLATRLSEPLRGGTDDPEPALRPRTKRPVPFAEARRILLVGQDAASVSSRRGCSSAPASFLWPTCCRCSSSEVFDLGPFARGLIGAAQRRRHVHRRAVVEPMDRRMDGQGDGRARQASRALALGVGVGLAVLAGTPWLALWIVLVAIRHELRGRHLLPAVLRDPGVRLARARSHACRSRSARLYLVAGVWLLYFLPGIARIPDDHGLRWGLLVTVPYWLIGGLLLRSAHRFVADDTNKALAQLNFAADMRAQRLDGRGHRSAAGVPRRRGGLRPGAGAVRRRHGGAPRRDRRAARHQRRRQVDAAQGHQRRRRPDRRRDLLRGARHHPRRRRADHRARHHPGARRQGGVPHADRGRAPPRRGVAVSRRSRATSKTANAEVLDDLPAPARAHRSDGGQPVGRRAADAGARHGVHRQAQAADDRRAVARPGADDRRAAPRHRAADPGDNGTAIILVEQSINVALTVAERAYFLEKGEVRFEGATAELLERDDIVRSVFLEGAGGSRRRRRAAAPRSAAAARVRRSSRSCSTCDRLTKRFGGIRAVDDTSFALRDGEILGLIGPNGAGKTTIFDLISGFVMPDEGRIHLDGVDVTDHERRHAGPGCGLGRSFQDARLVPSLTVAENIAIGLDRHLELRDHMASMLSLPADRAPGGGRGLERRGSRRADVARRLPRQVRARAVHRLAPHRRPGDVHRPRPEGAAARRAVVGHRAARDRSARTAAAAHPSATPGARCW